MLSTGSPYGLSGVTCANAVCLDGRKPSHSLDTGKSSPNGSSGCASSPEGQNICFDFFFSEYLWFEDSLPIRSDNTTVSLMDYKPGWNQWTSSCRRDRWSSRSQHEPQRDLWAGPASQRFRGITDRSRSGSLRAPADDLPEQHHSWSSCCRCGRRRRKRLGCGPAGAALVCPFPEKLFHSVCI